VSDQGPDPIQIKKIRSIPEPESEPELDLTRYRLKKIDPYPIHLFLKMSDWIGFELDRVDPSERINN
jgi:hypothetical protein